MPPQLEKNHVARGWRFWITLVLVGVLVAWLSWKVSVGTTCDPGSVLDPANPDFPGGSGRRSKDPRRDDVCSPARAFGWGSALMLSLESRWHWSFTPCCWRGCGCVYSTFAGSSELRVSNMMLILSLKLSPSTQLPHVTWLPLTHPQISD